MPDTWLDGRLGPEAEVRPGFAADLEERLQAGWRGEPTVTPIAGAPRRRRWPLLVWGGAAAALVAAVVLVAVRRDDDNHPVGPATSTSVVPSTSTTSPPSTSVAAPTTVTATTVAAPTSTAPASTAAPTTAAVQQTGTTLAVPLASGGDVWGRPCTEGVRSTPQPTPAGDASTAPLGPLGARPMATITYPLDIGGDGNPPSVATAAVPGGMLFVLNGRDSAGGPGSVATVVDADGQARWTRCWPGQSMDLLGAGDGLAVVWSEVGSSAAELIDLTDGTRRGLLADHLASAGVDPSGFQLGGLGYAFGDDRDVVFSTSAGNPVDAATDRLLVVDLDTLSGSVVPLPAAAGGAQVLQYERNAAGDLLLVDPNRQQRPLAALTGGGWSTAPADLARWSGVRANWAYDVDGQPLRGIDGQGNVVWTSDEVFNSLMGEAQDVRTVGEMTVGLACRQPVDTALFECAGGVELVGVRSSDGTVAWRLPAAGVRPGDRLAIVTDNAFGGDGNGWVMLDTVTGAAVDGWSSSAAGEFGSECCGGDETDRTEVHGGIVVTVHGGTIHLWYPAGTPAAGTTLSLP